MVVVRARLRALRERPEPTAAVVPPRRRRWLAFGAALGAAALGTLLVVGASVGLIGLAAIGPQVMTPPESPSPVKTAPDDPVLEVPAQELVPLRRVPARYPAVGRVRDDGEQTCTARVFIDETGAVYEAIVEGCAEPFREAAEAAYLQWRYQPFLSRGQPTRVQTVLRMRFKLKPPAGGPG